MFSIGKSACTLFALQLFKQTNLSNLIIIFKLDIDVKQWKQRILSTNSILFKILFRPRLYLG